MSEYVKTKVNNMVSVKSIATALRVDLSNSVSRDEQHDFPEIFYMAEKEGSTVINGERLLLKAGQMVIYAANAVHGDAKGGVAEIISFETEAPLPDSLFNRVITLTGEQRVMLRGTIAKAMSLFEYRIGVYGMVLKQNADPYLLQSVKNALELFLLDMLCPSDNYDTSRMQSLTDYMIKNIGSVLTLQQISEDLGLSISTIKRVVQKNCGQAPLVYFRELKILEAKRLIADTPLNMTEIANRLGFSSVHHFSKTFKQKTGSTPTEYAKNASRK